MHSVRRNRACLPDNFAPMRTAQPHRVLLDDGHNSMSTVRVDRWMGCWMDGIAEALARERTNVWWADMVTHVQTKLSNKTAFT